MYRILQDFSLSINFRECCYAIFWRCL